MQPEDSSIAQRLSRIKNPYLSDPGEPGKRQIGSGGLSFCDKSLRVWICGLIFNEAQIPSCSSLFASLCYDLVCCDSGSQKNKLSQGSAFLT